LKLIITIPAFNEEESIGKVISSLPRKLEGVDEIEVLVSSDGSTDSTVEIAQKAGADKVIHSRMNQGLARTFKVTLWEALNMGADIIVNIDADGQYDANEMQRLIDPIICGEADIVLGSRFSGTIEDMTRSKRVGNKFGTWVIRHVSGVSITDSATGYRAFTRHAAMKMNVISSHTYTQDTIVQAGLKKLKVVEVPISFLKRDAGSSRLVSSFFNYGSRSGVTTAKYVSLKYLQSLIFILTTISFSVGIIFGVRVLIQFFSSGTVSPYIPSAILSGFGFIFGLQLLALGMMSGLIIDNRSLMEDVFYMVKDMKSKK